MTAAPVLGGGSLHYEVAGRTRAIDCGGLELLQNGVQVTRMPVAEFYANWAYLVIGSLAWNLKAWTAQLMPRRLGVRVALLKMEFRRFLMEVILVPAQIVTSGRRRIYRLLAVNRWTKLLLDGSSTSERDALREA